MLPQNIDGGFQTSNGGGQTSDDDGADSRVADVVTAGVPKNGLWFSYVVKSLSLFMAHGRSDHQSRRDDRDFEEAPLLEEEIPTGGHVIDTEISTDKDELVRSDRQSRRNDDDDRDVEALLLEQEIATGGQSSDEDGGAGSYVADAAATRVPKNGLWFSYVVKSLSLFMAHGRSDRQSRRDDRDFEEAPLLEEEIPTGGHVIDIEISTDKDELVRSDRQSRRNDDDDRDVEALLLEQEIATGGQSSDEDGGAGYCVADAAATRVPKNGLWFSYVVKSLSLFMAHGRSDHQTRRDDRDVEEAPLLEQESANGGHVAEDELVRSDHQSRSGDDDDDDDDDHDGDIEEAPEQEIVTGSQTSSDEVADVVNTGAVINGLWFCYVVKSLSLFMAHGRSDHQSRRCDEDDDDDGHVAAPLREQGTAAGGCVIEVQTSTDKDKLVRIVKNKDLSGLRRLGGIDRVLSLQRSHFEDDGIGDQSGQDYSWESIHFMFFLKQALNSFTIFLLFVAAVLLFCVGIFEQGAKEGWHDGAAVVVGIFLLVSFSSVGNFLHERKAVKRMVKEKNEMKPVAVERNGRSLQVSLSQVRVWDTVHLRVGDRIPADGLLTSAERLRTDEVDGSETDRDSNPFLVSGSKVREGSGSMIVVVSDFGSTENLVAGENLHDSREGVLFYALMQKPYDFIENLALCMSVVIASIALIRLVFKTRDDYNNGGPEMKGQLTMKTVVKMFEMIILKPQGRVSTLMSVLVMLVIGVQHGMPLVVVICLRHWRAKLSDSRVTVHSLRACCTLGLVTAVVVDGGNGDLLHEKPEVKSFVMGERDLIGKEFESSESDRLGVLNSIMRSGICWDDVPEISTNVAQKATVSWEKNPKWGTTNLEENSRVVEYRRSSSSGKKDCEVLLRQIGEVEPSFNVHWKGPPLIILEMCSHFYDFDGEIRVLQDDPTKLKLERLIEDMKIKGLIPIAFAHQQTNDAELANEGLILLAIVGLKYKCQRDLEALVKDLTENEGLSIEFVSKGGDPEIVKSISHRLRLSTSSDDDTVIDVDQGMDKFQKIEKLQENGFVVAFVGGSSIRDIPVLKKADLVIVQKTRCIEIAKGNSDILLNNSAPHALTVIRGRGKRLYHNMQKLFELQLTFWISGLSVIVVSTMHSGESPLSSVQMIWVSLILSLLWGLVMVMELNNYDNQSSRTRSQSLVTQETWANIAIQALCQVSLLLVIHFLNQTKYASTKNGRDILDSMIFNIFTLCQIFNLFSSMKLARKEVLKIVLSDIWFVSALLAVLCCQVIIVQFGKGFLGCEKLDMKHWALCFLLVTFLSIVNSVVHRLVPRFSL